MITRPALRDYQDLVDRIRARLVNTGGIHELVQIGEVAAPGISDLDLCIFYESGFSQKDTFQSIRQIQQATTIKLDIRFIPVELREYIHWLLPVSTDSPSIAPLPIKTRRHLAYVYLMVLMPEKLRRLSLLMKRRTLSDIDFRQLYSLKYTMQQLALLDSLDTAEVFSLVQQIQNLRLDWIAENSCQPNFSELVDRVHTAVLQGFSKLRFSDFQTNDKGPARIMFDWCTLMDFGRYTSLKIAHLPGTTLLPNQHDSIVPCRLQANYQWGAILGYFYKHPKLSDMLPPVHGTLATHQTQSEHICKLVDIYAQIQDSHRSNGIATGSILRSIYRKDHYKLPNAYRSVCSMLAQLFIGKYG